MEERRGGPTDRRNVDHEARLTTLEFQVGRIMSDITSEKGTRARVNADMKAELKDIYQRLRVIERLQWGFIGALIVIEFFARVVVK